MTPESRDIPIGLIDEPELPMRNDMPDEGLDELSADIRRKGVLQPLIVAPQADRYRVIAGHRRWHAAKRAGLAAVPCRVYASPPADLEGLKYSENRHREDVNPADEALYFAQVLERDCGDDVDRLCELLGEKRPRVEGRLLLLAGDLEVFQALKENRIKIGVAQQLNRCTDERRRRNLLHSAIVGGATATLVSSWITAWQYELQQMGPSEPVQPSAPAPIPHHDPFRCEVCRKSRPEHVHLIRHVPMHDYCIEAILKPLLQSYRGESDPTPVEGDPRRI